MNYAIEQRLRLIDFLLDHYGYVNRSALVDYFGIVVVSATSDFNRYKEIAPDNLYYNSTKKCYLKTDSFKKVY